MKLEGLLTAKNVVIALALITILAFYVIPYMAYVFHAVDRHYFGYFNDREPRLALTTAKEKYFKDHNIPYKTISDVNAETRINDHLRATEQLDPHMDKYLEAQEKTFNMTYITSYFHGRRLQDDTTD